MVLGLEAVPIIIFYTYYNTSFLVVGWVPGWCSDHAGDDQNKGLIELKAGDKDKCLEACRQYGGATGCEYNNYHNHCSVHMQNVNFGSGPSYFSCFVFGNDGEGEKLSRSGIFFYLLL